MRVMPKRNSDELWPASQRNPRARTFGGEAIVMGDSARDGPKSHEAQTSPPSSVVVNA
jgi:hypothetical protein